MKIAVMPPGALSAAFYFHARLDGFIGKSNSMGVKALKQAEKLNFCDPLGGKIFSKSLKKILYSDISEAFEKGFFPQLILLTFHPHQWEEYALELGKLLKTVPEGKTPIFILLSNGIIFQNFLKSLSDWLPLMLIKEKFLRGISLQAGNRQGEGKHLVFLPGKGGEIKFCSDSSEVGNKIQSEFAQRGYKATYLKGVHPLELETMKALATLIVNAFPLKSLLCHKTKKVFDFRMGDQLQDPLFHFEMGQLLQACFETAKVQGLFRGKSLDEVWPPLQASILKNGDHRCSTLEEVLLLCKKGEGLTHLPVNVDCLLDPLIDLCEKFQLGKELTLFKKLRADILSTLKGIDQKVKKYERQLWEPHSKQPFTL